MIETTAPVKKAQYKAITILGNPKKNPIKKANLTSPSPIPRPRVIINNDPKNARALMAERKLDIKILGYWDTRKIKVIRIAGKTILSGIIPYRRSVKKITISEERI